MRRDYFNTQSWTEMVRFGVPEFVVKNKPLLWDGETLKVGQVFPKNHPRSNAGKLRVLYELHLIAPKKEEAVEEAKKRGRKKVCQ